MLRLILMRHAKSDWSLGGQSDHDRPLNKRGRASAAALGDWLRQKDLSPEEVMCSSAKRTTETLSGLRLSPDPQTEFVGRLYHAAPRTMLEILNGATSSCVLMVGHNPGICDMAHRLLSVAPDHARFADYPTGSTLVCDFEATDWMSVDWHQGQCVDFVVARELMAI